MAMISGDSRPIRITTYADQEAPLQHTKKAPQWHEFLGWYVAALLLLLLVLAVDGWTREQDMRSHMEKQLHDCVSGFE